MSLLEILRGGEVLIIPHWDIDGIASAAMVIRHACPDAEIYIPPIARYQIPEDELWQVSGMRPVLLLDLSIGRSEVEKILRASGSRVIIVDHHHCAEAQPSGVAVYGRDGADPSNTLLLSRLLGLEQPSLLVALGIVGDVGDRGLGEEEAKIVKEVCDRHGITLEDLRTICRLVDANYIVGDRLAVKDAIYELVIHGEEPSSLLENPLWRRRLRMVDEEVARVLSEGHEVVGNVVLKRFSSRFCVISRVGREVAKQNPDRVCIVVNTGLFDDVDQVYIRTMRDDVDIRPLIEEALRRGYVAGGKREVMGALVPKAETEAFVEEAVRRLGGGEG